jgi:hypothetical protein
VNFSRCRLVGAFVICASLIVASCGGGSVDGIDGTGSPAAALAYGRLLSFGSVEVNGIHYDTTDATFLIDGTMGSQTDLNLGDIVLVVGQIQPGATRGVAQQVVSDHVLLGRVGSVSSDGLSLVALGQTVRVEPQTTIFDAGLGTGLSVLSPGDSVSVSGFRNAAGEILATRISRQTGSTLSFKTTGAVTAVDSSTLRLQINGLTVDYSGAQLLPADAANALAPGVFVEVKAGTFTDGQLFVATSVEIKRQRLPGAADTGADVEGYVTSVDSNATRFHIDGFPILTTSGTDVGTLPTGTQLQVMGMLNDGGEVIAGQVQPILPPFPVPPSAGLLQGHVFDAISGPVAGADVDVWVQLANGDGYSNTAVTGNTPQTDANGLFSIPAPGGGGLLAVTAWRSGFVQPCAVIVNSNSGSVNVELVALSTLDASNPPPPLSAVGAITMTGTVYEVVAGNRQPIAGAMLTFEGVDLPLATTVSDRNGHYLVCNVGSGSGGVGQLATGRDLYATKPGFVDVDVYPIDTSRSTVVDIEMKRQ